MWGTYQMCLVGTAAIRAARLTDEDKERIEKQKNDTRPLKLKILDFPKALFILVSGHFYSFTLLHYIFITKCALQFSLRILLVRKDIDINKYEKLSNFTRRH